MLSLAAYTGDSDDSDNEDSPAEEQKETKETEEMAAPEQEAASKVNDEAEARTADSGDGSGGGKDEEDNGDDSIYNRFGPARPLEGEEQQGLEEQQQGLEGEQQGLEGEQESMESMGKAKEKKKKKKKDKDKKKKDKKPRVFLPNASELLANMPLSLLGRPENIILSDDEENKPVDAKGTKYNNVPLPASLNHGVTMEEKWRMKPMLSLDKERAKWDKKVAHVNKQAAREGRREDKKALAPPPAPPATMFAPRQLATKKANVSTEDLEGWNSSKNKKAKVGTVSSFAPPSPICDEP